MYPKVLTNKLWKLKSLTVFYNICFLDESLWYEDWVCCLMTTDPFFVVKDFPNKIDWTREGLSELIVPGWLLTRVTYPEYYSPAPQLTRPGQ